MASPTLLRWTKLDLSGSLASVISLDLTKLEDQELVLQWLENPAVCAVFLAPPCGTSSAARQIQWPGEDLPKPLRSLDEPDGLSTLHGIDKLRVSAANVLYAFTADVMEKCCRLHILCMVENPRNSLFWFVTCWVEMPLAHLLFFQDHQACMYGSKRPKFTRLCANFEQVGTISMLCDNSHEHEPWGVIRHGAKRTFATALEVHYPKALCEAIVRAFMLGLVAKGMELDVHKITLHHAAKAFTGQQTSSMKVPPLIPAYKHRYVVFLLDTRIQWPAIEPPPKEHKQLHNIQMGEVVSVELRDEYKRRILDELQIWAVDFAWESFTAFDGTFNNFSIFGIPWEPEEFMERSFSVNHPMDETNALPTELRFAVQQMASKSPAQIASLRLDFFKLWSKRAEELIPAEQELRSKMDPKVDIAVKSKRIALFGEMLEFYGYPDTGVLDELKLGASLTGDVAATGMLPAKFTPALLTEQSLRAQSKLRREHVERDCAGSGDPEVDKEVWEQTLQECEKGWLCGPLQPQQVPDDAPVSKRFGLRQRHKIRLIDDFSESSVNEAVSVFESPTLHTIDIAAAAVACWFGDCSEIGVASNLEVRTFDLASAYRQVALSAEGRRVAYIRVFNPGTRRWDFFQAQVLPFGAIKSVHSFLRLARALWWLGTVACLLVWSSFFDDYILFSTPALSKSSDFTAAGLFALLGWDYAKDGRKCVPFSSACEALGVIINLHESSRGVCLVSNTDSRVSELAAELLKFVKAGEINQADAQRLRGRMQFAESQLFGRTGRRCIRALRNAASRGRTKLALHEKLALKLFVGLLESGRPRLVTWENRSPIVIFTDACYEKDAKDFACGLGAIFVDVQTKEQFFFSCQLDERQRTHLGELHKKQIIFEAESFCAVLAYLTWMNSLTGRNCFLYVDNEGTKFSLMKGTSENAVVDAICSVFAELESCVQTSCWLSRVPSSSNPADDPSRGLTHKLVAMGYKDISHIAKREVLRLLTFMLKKLGRLDECVVDLPMQKSESSCT